MRTHTMSIQRIINGSSTNRFHHSQVESIYCRNRLSANMYLKVAELVWFNMGYSVVVAEQPDCHESTSSLLISGNAKF